MDEDLLDSSILEQQCYVIIIILLLHIYNSSRNRMSLNRSALLPANRSSWIQILHGADEQSFFVLMGMSRSTFLKIEKIIFPENPKPQSRGGKFVLNNKGKLGMTLFYLGSRMELKHLAITFGVCPSTCSIYIYNTLRRICFNMRNHVDAKVKFPDEEEKRLFAALVANREPLASNIIGFVDGLSIPVNFGYLLSKM